jgi:hypothetical protein
MLLYREIPTPSTIISAAAQILMLQIMFILLSSTGSSRSHLFLLFPTNRSGWVDSVASCRCKSRRPHRGPACRAWCGRTRNVKGIGVYCQSRECLLEAHTKSCGAIGTRTSNPHSSLERKIGIGRIFAGPWLRNRGDG